MMTAVMMKADTRLASRGSNVGELGTILAGTQTQEGVFSHFKHTAAKINRLSLKNVILLSHLKHILVALTNVASFIFETHPDC